MNEIRLAMRTVLGGGFAGIDYIRKVEDIKYIILLDKLINLKLIMKLDA